MCEVTAAAETKYRVVNGDVLMLMLLVAD